MSIMPIRGTIRRSGANTGSVISMTIRTIGLSGLGLNHDINARMMIAKLSTKNTATVCRSKRCAAGVLKCGGRSMSA